LTFPDTILASAVAQLPPPMIATSSYDMILNYKIYDFTGYYYNFFGRLAIEPFLGIGMTEHYLFYFIGRHIFWQFNFKASFAVESYSIGYGILNQIGRIGLREGLIGKRMVVSQRLPYLLGQMRGKGSKNFSKCLTRRTSYPLLFQT